MSCDKWAYDPERCDSGVCVGDCDFCEVWQEDLLDEEDEKEIEREILAARKGEE